MTGWKRIMAFAIVLVVIFVLFPGFLILLLGNEKVIDCIPQNIDKTVLPLLDIAVNYFSMGSALFLGVIVYFQSQRINDLESTKFDVFLGIVGVDYGVITQNVLVAKPMGTVDDFLIIQRFSEHQTSYLAHLSWGRICNGKGTIVPLEFLLKSGVLVTCIDFKKIDVSLITSNFCTIHRPFENRTQPIYRVFEDNSKFTFSLGMMLPENINVEEIHLIFHIVIRDQLGREHNRELEAKLKSVSGEFYLYHCVAKSKIGEKQ